MKTSEIAEALDQAKKEDKANQMKEINDYESVKKCIKCNNDMFYDVPSDSSLYGNRSVRSIKYIAPISETEHVKKVPEHLEITCSECGYVHKEKCKDA